MNPKDRAFILAFALLFAVPFAFIAGVAGMYHFAVWCGIGEGGSQALSAVGGAILASTWAIMAAVWAED